MNIRSHRSLATAMLVSAALIPMTIAGCGGSTSATRAPGDGPTASGPVNPKHVTPKNLPAAPTIAKAVGARADVQLRDCALKGAKLAAAGVVTNPRTTPTDYLITVSWVNDRSDVLGRGVSVLRQVQPGRRTPWSTSTPGRDGITACTVLVQRGEVTR